MDPSEARHALITAANHFLFVGLPLHEPESRVALATLERVAASSPVAAADRHAVLLAILGVLNPHTGGRLPSLVERYLQKCGGRIGRLDVFGECVQDVIRYRGVGEPAIQFAIKTIEARFGESTFSQASVAEAVGLQPSALSRLFKQCTGLTFTEYLRDVRLDRAAFRLTTAKESIKEVWAGVGYNDGSNFDHEFDAKFGMSPSMYRKLSRQERADGADASERNSGDHENRSKLPKRAPAVLVVDDDPILCDTTKRLLTRSGFLVITAPDGKSGLAKACTTRLDVILLDYRLPDCDGLHFLRTLRHERPGPKPAVAVFTADWAAEERAAEILSLNAGLVFKLCDFETLERVVKSYSEMPLTAA